MSSGSTHSPALCRLHPQTMLASSHGKQRLSGVHRRTAFQLSLCLLQLQQQVRQL